jgi:hypothetical protein
MPAHVWPFNPGWSSQQKRRPILALWFGLEAENGGDSCLQILVVTFRHLMAEEHVLDACYILEICKLILNLFGAHTIVSQPMHPLAEQAQVRHKLLLPNWGTKITEIVRRQRRRH